MVKYEHLKSLHGSSLVSSYGTPTLNGTWIVLRIVRYIYPLSRHERSCYQLITDYASCLFGSLPSKPWFMFVSTIKKLDLENWDCFQKSGQFYHPGESKIFWCQLFQNSWLCSTAESAAFAPGGQILTKIDITTNITIIIIINIISIASTPIIISTTSIIAWASVP